MTFHRSWTNVARLAIACCFLSACGGGGGGAQKSGTINPKQRFDIARAAETSGNMVMARSMYSAAAAETEGDRAMQLQAAQGLARTGAVAEAIDVLQSFLRRSPGDQEARRTLGSLQIMSGSPGEAVETLSVVLKAQPNDDTARINKAVALDMLRRHGEAQQLYREALGRNPSDTEAANDLALSLALSGQIAEARTVLAPFRDRADLPERMRSTMSMVDGANAPAAATPPVSGNGQKPAGSAPTSLKPPAGHPKKIVKPHSASATAGQAPAIPVPAGQTPAR